MHFDFSGRGSGTHSGRDEHVADFPRSLDRERVHGMGFDDLGSELDVPPHRQKRHKAARHDLGHRAPLRPMDEEETISPIRIRHEEFPGGGDHTPSSMSVRTTSRRVSRGSSRVSVSYFSISTCFTVP